MNQSALRDDRRSFGPTDVDREALLVALVLAPATYSRNRFFDLYKNPDVRRVRRRASMLRSLLRQLGRKPDDDGAVDVVFVEREGGGAELKYAVPSLGLRRTARLDAIELSVVRFALANSGARSQASLSHDPQDPDRARIEGALARLAPG